MGWLPGSGTDGLGARIWCLWTGCQDLGLMGWVPGSGTDGLAARIWD
jgi:hypothetical protein